MGFKNYLKENPYLPMIDIACPYVHHQGGPINGSKDEYGYDAIAEVIKDNAFNQRMNAVYNFGNNKFGDAPVICRSDMKVFMWDGKKNTYAPTDPEDIKMCETFIEALNSEKSKDRNKGVDFSQATILTPEETKK